ncbi:CASP-like protein 1B1 [Glycine soja]|uniref:CASP-like protein n=1 Tax=Glycine soja TaxID=3848 RepID=A0A445JDX7_GLYSO|nr:CASP-like protein 1B1 [Glycine soja]KHN48115.1 CASP-like protein 9 [Glycine soja]RZB96650.1 CASP-like protein 1B1 [Glycine soja]
MASENGDKLELAFSVVPDPKPKKDWVNLSLRVVAFLATASATLVMAFNKQTKSMVVATIGTNPVTITLTAMLQHTPAFIFFVIVNAIASFYNMVVIGVEILGPQYDYKELRLGLIAILDVMTMALAATGDGAATFMAELGRNGNSHARWDKICDKFEAYCNRGGVALIASFVGLILLLVVTVMSITKMLKLNRI